MNPLLSVRSLNVKVFPPLLSAPLSNWADSRPIEKKPNSVENCPICVAISEILQCLTRLRLRREKKHQANVNINLDSCLDKYHKPSWKAFSYPIILI